MYSNHSTKVWIHCNLFKLWGSVSKQQSRYVPSIRTCAVQSISTLTLSLSGSCQCKLSSCSCHVPGCLMYSYLLCVPSILKCSVTLLNLVYDLLVRCQVFVRLYWDLKSICSACPPLHNLVQTF